MRKLEYINPLGVSVTMGGDSEITLPKCDGTGIPDIDIQEQRAPFQDGSTPIDQLYQPRSVDVECIIGASGEPSYYNPIKAQLCSAINPKLGPGTLIYTNDYGSWQISALPQGPVFNNTTVVDGPARYQITFYCHNPYWQDVTDTVITLSTGAASQVAVVTSDVPVPVKIEVTGLCRNPIILEVIQDVKMEYSGVIDKSLSIDTSFGNKSVFFDRGDLWDVRSIGTLYGIAYDGDMTYIAVGRNGVFSSVDGQTWTSRVIDTNHYVMSVAYAKALKNWCVVDNVGNVFTSQDGITWTNTASTFTGFKVWCYSEKLGIWCGGGSSGIYTSVDATTWTNRSAAVLTNAFYSEYQGIFCGFSSGGNVYTSTNGITWTSTASGLSYNSLYVSYSNTLNQWCAVGDYVGPVGVIATSSDGTTWTARTSGTTKSLVSVSYSEVIELWVVCGTGSGSSGGVLTSANGIDWTTQSIGSPGPLNSVFADSKILVSGDTSIIHSTNGTLWNISNSSVSVDIDGAVFCSDLGMWVIASSSGSIYTSSDLVQWTQRFYLSTTSLYGVGYSSVLKQLCAVGSDSISGTVILTSSDGLTWENQTPSETSSSLKSVTYSNIQNKWCAVGTGGKILTSTDGILWANQTSGTSVSLNSVSYSDILNQWCAVGYDTSFNGVILTSANGSAWVKRVSGFYKLYGVSYSPVIGKWCAVGNYSATSDNGIDWSIAAISSVFNALSYSNSSKKWIAAGWDGTHINAGLVSSSVDGSVWDSPQVVSQKILNSVAYNFSDDEWLVGGRSGSAVSSSGDSSVSVIQNINPASKFFQLQPGRNVLSVSCLAGNATATVTYRNRFGGR